MSQHAESIHDDPWRDDVLDRRHLAEMLESHLLARFEARDGAPLSIAIDGRWGSGKTFFVERWTAQLRAGRRCVIEFDAWQHDQAGDPALAFMAEVSRQVKEQTALVIDSEATAKVIDSALSDALSSMKRAIKPLSKALLGAAVKKFIGMSVNEMAEAATSDDAESEKSDNTSNRALDQAIEKYLDQIMADYELRHASVAKFKENLEGLASSLAKASNGPVFVVIDELDRCRPSFAVQLLEGVKHLFSVPNVCFAFSTNLTQLAASVQAVYGPHFNGRDYLGRFFDQELRLPLPSGDQFAKLLFQQSDSPSVSRRYYGNFISPRFYEESRGVGIWAVICQALGVTLRQQQQAFATFVISCESYPSTLVIPAVWLAFLSLLHRSYPSVFETLHHAKGLGWEYSKFAEALKGTTWEEQPLHREGYRPTDTNAQISLSELLYRYFAVSKLVQPEDMQHCSSSRDVAVGDFDRYLTGASKLGAPSNLHLPFYIVSTAGLFSQGANDSDR